VTAGVPRSSLFPHLLGTLWGQPGLGERRRTQQTHAIGRNPPPPDKTPPRPPPGPTNALPSLFSAAAGVSENR